MKSTPGSPLFHADSTIRSKISFAFAFFTISFVLGFISGYSLPSSTAFIKTSVTATDILKFVSSRGSFFTVAKSMISGWSTRNTPIFAPLLVPPCFMTSVAVLKTFIKDTGPLAAPLVEPTISSFGLSLEKEKPVPPPD